MKRWYLFFSSLLLWQSILAVPELFLTALGYILLTMSPPLTDFLSVPRWQFDHNLTARWKAKLFGKFGKIIPVLIFSTKQVLRSLAPGIIIKCSHFCRGIHIFCWAIQNGHADGIPPTWQPPGGRLFFYICNHHIFFGLLNLTHSKLEENISYR